MEISIIILDNQVAISIQKYSKYFDKVTIINLAKAVKNDKVPLVCDHCINLSTDLDNVELKILSNRKLNIHGTTALTQAVLRIFDMKIYWQDKVS